MADATNNAAVAPFLLAIQAFIASFFNDAGVKSIISAVFLSFGLAIFAAWRKGEFTIYKLPNFLVDHLPYALAYFVLKLFSESAGLGAFVPVALVLIMSKFTASMIESLNVLGLPMPDSVLALVKKSGSVK